MYSKFAQSRGEERSGQAAPGIAAHAPLSAQQKREAKNAHGIAHIASGPKREDAKRSQTLLSSGQQLMHRRVDTSLYVRNVAGLAGHTSIVKNAGKEKGTTQAVVAGASSAGAGKSNLKDPRLLAR